MKYVDTPESLAPVVRALHDAPWAAVDTEADSLHHYLEKLCLLQISVPHEDFVIDPLTGLDLRELAAVLGRKPLILHGADFDIRIIKRFWNFNPARIFDTLFAAQLLGYEKQGFADLVERHAGVKLSKKSQTADWSKRPLTEEMLDYAFKDTHYLHPVKAALEAELVALGRLDWHRQCCEKLLKALSAAQEPERDTEREWQVKGARALKGKALTILKALWYWREETAKKFDRPLFKILNTEYLPQIAQWAAENPEEDIVKMPKAPSNVRGQWREVLNELVRVTAAHPQAVFTEKPKKKGGKRWTDQDEKRFNALKAERVAVAEPLKIHPSLLGTNAVLERITQARPKTREELDRLDLLMPWQADLMGERIYKISIGDGSLSIGDGSR